jgi:hypothetical protein
VSKENHQPIIAFPGAQSKTGSLLCENASQSTPATHAAYKVVRRRGCCSRWAFGSNRTVRFLGSSQISVPRYQGPFGSLSVQELTNFGFGSIGSVPVLTEGTDLFQDEKTAHSKVNFSSISSAFFMQSTGVIQTNRA